MDVTFPTRLNDQVEVIPFPTNIGIIHTKSGIVLIDSGLNTENAKEIDNILCNYTDERVSIIINTHSNADHAGGNQYFQDKYNCEIWATAGEKPFIERPYLEATILWGGYPFKEIRTPAFECEPSRVTRIIKENEVVRLDANNSIKFISLPGHYVDMIGIFHTNSNLGKTFFLGDSIFGAQVINKYCISYMLNISMFIDTLHKISNMHADYYIPSHGTIITSPLEIQRVAQMNENEIRRIQDKLITYCNYYISFEQILEKIFSDYHIRTTKSQYVLIGSTIRNYLVDLYSNGIIDMKVENGKMLFKTI